MRLHGRLRWRGLLLSGRRMLLLLYASCGHRRGTGLLLGREGLARSCTLRRGLLRRLLALRSRSLVLSWGHLLRLLHLLLLLLWCCLRLLATLGLPLLTRSGSSGGGSSLLLLELELLLLQFLLLATLAEGENLMRHERLEHGRAGQSKPEVCLADGVPMRHVRL